MAFNTLWTWNEIFTALYRERSAGSTLEVPARELECHPSQVGMAHISSQGPAWHIEVSDGSIMTVQINKGMALISLEAAPLPELDLSLPDINFSWLSIHSGFALVLLGLLGSLAQ